MKAYIQSRNGMPRGTSQYTAWLGFKNMGIETVLFETVDDLNVCEREDVVVGGLGVVRARLRALGVDASEINYPEELRPFLGRRLWKTTIDHVNTEVGTWPLFVKPVEGKRFTGCVVASSKDLVGKGCYGEDFPVICSEVVDFVSEYRCFVKYGEILDVRHYRGDWSKAPSRAAIEQAIAAYDSAPAGYAADFGVTSDGRTLLVEVNDGYSLGPYGLWPELYAQLLSARWAQMVGTNDPCDFGVPVPRM
ncbi:hypothetical protein AUL39_03475 [Tractidigestivibacter scatoligenes]|uniref:ATP-grasp domain-containing protein n=1 Tax=Tractidigestivibacter scatoligenes TaxID=1299998 RepID=A0A100YX95_TRASO|nr:ATP-grasp domain-containing protein [Tractidigestivibacter scatoligenes]KUH59390.1 hypothetical protein AUL39_03475 [Tractidigestivibacter scatoligenes]